MRAIAAYFSVLIFSSAGLAQAPTLTELVDSNPLPPPVAPTNSRAGGKAGTVLENLLPGAQRAVIIALHDKRFEIERDKGLAEMAKSGQKGVLIKSSVVFAQNSMGDVYSLLGHGVQLIGVGPDPNGVCLAKKCQDYIGPGLLSGQKFVPELGYTWVSRDAKGKLVSASYDRTLMEGRASAVTFTNHLRQTQLDAYVATAVGDYMEAMAAKATTVKQRQDLRNAVDTRKKLLTDRAQLEATHTDLMERARKASMVLANLQMMSQVFDVAGAVNMAGALLNQDMAATGPVDTKAALANTVAKIGDSATKTASSTLEQLTAADIRLMEIEGRAAVALPLSTSPFNYVPLPAQERVKIKFRR